MDNLELKNLLDANVQVVLSEDSGFYVLCKDGSVRDHKDRSVLPADTNRAAYYTAQKNKRLYVSYGADQTLTADQKAKAKSNIGAVLDNQAASTASDVAGIVSDFNALLADLKAKGLMTADS